MHFRNLVYLACPGRGYDFHIWGVSDNGDDRTSVQSEYFEASGWGRDQAIDGTAGRQGGKTGSRREQQSRESENLFFFF